MRHRSFAKRLGSLLLGLLLALPLSAQDRELDAARRLLQRGQFERARAACRELVEAHPESGDAWFLLASAHHGLGQYGEAARVGERAAEFPELRPTALYNVACARALAGDLDDARRVLREARQAGFLDFDLMATDPDLESIRAEIELPTARTFDRIRGRNGVEFEYLVEEPTGGEAHASQQASPEILISFSPGGGGPLATSWAIEELWRGAPARGGWVVVHVVAPERGWMNHPAHHALDDLLKDLAKRFDVPRDAFHAFGFAGGARAATTFARMSSYHFRDLTVASILAWSGWDSAGLRRFGDTPVRMILGEHDPGGLMQAEWVRREHERGNIRLHVEPDATRTLEGLRGQRLFELVRAGLED